MLQWPGCTEILRVPSREAEENLIGNDLQNDVEVVRMTTSKVEEGAAEEKAARRLREL